MQEPSLPLDETQRLLSLHSLRLLDTPDEERFDRVTRMARRMFGVDTCLVSLVDGNRQWFKSKTGLDACETGRDISFCGHAILTDQVFIVEDTLQDERFADNPLVTGPPNIRFYAGVPIKSPDGQRIGTLCLIHPEPRQLTADEQLTLEDLGHMVEDEIRISSEAVIDELTKVANRRGFHMFANQTLAVCRRTGPPADVACFDLEGCKDINATIGRAAGDDREQVARPVGACRTP